MNPIINPSEIEALLEQVKPTSMTQIITFITTQVSKINHQKISQIEERVSELEQPKGMDRVMIQEVKTLVEAMLDQRQQALRKEVERKYKQTVCNSFESNEQSRRSLQQIDFVNAMNMQHPFHSQQIKRVPTQILPIKQDIIKLEAVRNQLEQLKKQLLGKADRREMQELRQALSSASKELINKLNFEQAQKLILKFQKEIFVKFNQEKGCVDQIESKMIKIIDIKNEQLRLDLQEVTKCKAASSKLQKKTKKYLEEMAYVRSDLQKIANNLSQHQKQCRSNHQNQLDNMEQIQSLIEKIAETPPTLVEKEGNFSSLFISTPIITKNSQIAWEKQLFNTDPGNIQFEKGKTSIRVITAGFYQVACLVYNCKGNTKAPTLMCNGEIVSKFQCKGCQSELIPRWECKQWLHVRQGKSVISVRYQGEENSAYALLQIRRAAC